MSCVAIFRWRKPYLFLLHFSRIHFASRKILCNPFHHLVDFKMRFSITFWKTSCWFGFGFFYNFSKTCLFVYFCLALVSSNTKMKNFYFGKTVFLTQVFSPALEWRRIVNLATFKKDRNKVVFFFCCPFSSIILMILLKWLAESVCSFLFSLAKLPVCCYPCLLIDSFQCFQLQRLKSREINERGLGWKVAREG